MADEVELRKFLRDTDFSQYIHDKEVRDLVQQLYILVAKKGAHTPRATQNGTVSATVGAAPIVEESNLNLSNCTRIKIVVVGDGAVGKTSLLISYATDKFPEEYVPTVFENYSTQIPREDGSSILLHLWDTAGQEEYDRLRPLSYPSADIVLLCFSTVNKASFHSIKEKWFPEVHHYIPTVPYMLIGTKIDCRENKQVDPNLGRFDPVDQATGKKFADEIKALKYLEVSAKTRQGLVVVFQEAMNAVLHARGESVPPIANPKKKGDGCTLI